MSDDPQSGAEPFGRPLPRVEIPILREHRVAAKRRRVALAGLLLIAIIGSIAGALGYASLRPSTPANAVVATNDAGALAFVDASIDGGEATDAGVDAGPSNVRVEQPDEHLDTTNSSTPVTRGATSRRSSAFGQSVAFRTALTNAGLSRDEASGVEQALDGVLDFRRCRPEHQLVVERDAQNRLVRFEYRTSATTTEYVAVTRDGQERLVGNRVQIPVERIRLVKGARVSTTLGAALESVGLRESLVSAFIEAFRGRADFGHDTRQGDSFRIIVDEERVHGRFLRYGRIHAIDYKGGGTGHLRAYGFETARGRIELYDGEARELDGSWLTFPCRFDRISSQFDPRRMHPVLRRIQPHNGTDFAAPTGTPVWAAAAGTIVWAGPKGPNGNLVSIQHDGGYTTHYAHLFRITAGITRGAHVSQRQSIGQVGTTGRSTGPHLHFGLKRGSTFLDPMAVLNGPGRQLTGNALASFRRLQRTLDRELDAIAVP